MKAGLTITEMAQEIERQSTAKADYLVNPQALEMEALGGPPMLRVLDNSGVDQMEPLVIQETAHRQMGAHLGIPWKYYDKMLQEDPDLLAYNVNRWFQTREPTQRLLRTIDGRARAFLSNRYRRIDNFEMSESAPARNSAIFSSVSIGSANTRIGIGLVIRKILIISTLSMSDTRKSMISRQHAPFDA